MLCLGLTNVPSGIMVRAAMLTLLFSCPTVWANNTQVQFDEVLAGANGDSRIQFIEIKHAQFHNQWGPPKAGLPSRAELAFFDARGELVGEFDFPGDPPQMPGTQDPTTPTLFSAIIATREFVDATGLAADFIIPPNVIARAGKVCFQDNDGAFPIELCISYGDNLSPDVENGKLPYVGPVGGEGPPVDALPITDAASVRRFRKFTCVGQGCHTTRDFSLNSPSPRNGAGQTATITVASTELQGKTLFNEETFLGNGRSCFTCHRPQDGFGLNPSTIAALPPNDPLFVAEFNPDLSQLENPCLMRGGRALILENVHGFDADPVFRNSMHLMNIGATAPYGWSPRFGGAPDLVTFAQGAVKQHFPKFLPRNFDPTVGPISQRTGTVEELTYMQDFQVTIKTKVYDGLGDLNTTGNSIDREENLDRLIAAYIRCNDTPTLADIEAGRFLAGRFCIECHVDPFLGLDEDLEIGIGVSNDPANQDDGCIGGPFDPTLPLPSEQEACEANPECREPDGPHDTPEMNFGIRPLVDIARVKEVFFKGGEAATLRESVAYYTTDAFRNSESGAQQNIELNDTEIDQVTAFLQAIVETPPCSGACCLRGVCEIMSDEAECVAACGSWQGMGSTCETTTCGPPRQACCQPAFVGYICRELIPCECLELGGEPLGDGTACEEDTCSEGGE